MLKRSFILLITSVVFLASCEKSQSTSSTGGSKPTDPKQVKIVYIPKNTGNPYFNAVIDGFKESAISGHLRADPLLQAFHIEDFSI